MEASNSAIGRPMPSVWSSSSSSCCCVRMFLMAVTMFLSPYFTSASPVNPSFRDCGGDLRAYHGIIQSPNFPGPFPVPIFCRWVIHVPRGRKTVIYFTQYFMRHSFYITEYDEYKSPKDYSNKKEIGQIDAIDSYNTVVVYRQFVVIDLRATDSTNIHLRVEEHLMDVHGFNISYHLVPTDAQLDANACSVEKCSYLGHCLASAGFKSMKFYENDEDLPSTVGTSDLDQHKLKMFLAATLL